MQDWEDLKEAAIVGMMTGIVFASIIFIIIIASL